MEFSEMQFLVAEDHAFQRRSLVRILNELGAAQVVEAADGNAAFTAFTDFGRPLDIIICDLDMPGMNGMELMWRISRTGAPAAVILMSRLGAALAASVGDMAGSYGINVIGVIEKPVTREKLLSLVGEHEKTWAGVAKRTRARIPSAAQAAHDNEAAPAGFANISRETSVVNEAGGAADAPIDWRVFREMWKLDEAGERELLRDLRDANEVDLAALNENFEHDERQVVARAAHRIGGASRSVGALQLADACADLEYAAECADRARMTYSYGAVLREARRLNEILDSI